jgi:hypothetical protein
MHSVILVGRFALAKMAELAQKPIYNVRESKNEWQKDKR